EVEVPLSCPESLENSKNFEPEIEIKEGSLSYCSAIENSEALYYWGFKAESDLLYRAFNEVCLEIYSVLDCKTLTIASSSDEKKMSLHISAFDIVDNIVNKSLFSLQILNIPKVIEIKCNESSKKLYKHICPKRAIFPKDGTVFDFMLCLPNDKAPVIDNPILVLKDKMSIEDRSIPEKNKIDARTIEAEVNYIEKLLNEMNIKSFDVLYPTTVSPDIFTLRNITGSHCPLCNREHSNDNKYIVQKRKTYYFYCHRADKDMPKGTKKPLLKLIINETVGN
ncbi:24735_t:CDS:2, partial [Cetraspora pellucida]